MIGTVEFIKCAGSLATSEIPLLEADGDMDTYVEQKYENVKFVEDMVQALVLPSFDGWSGCNMVRLTQTNQAEGKQPWKAYYWITDANRSSDVAGATVFNIEFNAITTMLKKNSKVYGQWVRSPVNFTPWIQQNVASGTMGLMKQIPLLKKMPIDPVSQYSTLWVSITASRNPSGKDGSYEIYGFPIYAASLERLYSDFEFHVVGIETDGATATYFPTLQELFHGETLEAIGLPPSAIIDISVTPYMPFKSVFVDYTLSEGTKNVFMTYGLDTTHITYNDGEDRKSTRIMYNITSYSSLNIMLVQETKSVNVDTMYATAAQYSIMKGDGSLITQIPPNWLYKTDDNKFELKLRGQVICDYSQILYRIEVLKPNPGTDETEALGYFTIPGTHVPYMGTAWDDYRAYSMANDREAMQFSIDQAKQQALANIADAAINTVIGVATGGASYAAGNAVRAATQYSSSAMRTATQNAANVAYQQQQNATVAQGGSGIISAALGYFQAEKSAKFNQAMTEKKVQSQPGNAFNATDGLFNLYMEMANPTCLAISLPVNMTTDMFNNFIKDFGYANEGEYKMSMGYGFYQGTVFSDAILMTGPRFVELVNAFMSGVRLITPSGDVPYTPPSANGIFAIAE